MNYVSTRNKTIKITASEAILRGLAPDGGLFIPDEIPSCGLSENDLLTMDTYELTSHILKKLLPDLPGDKISKAVRDGYYGKFDTPDITPVKELDGMSVLELYHGPTSAFKDMALCLLPHLIAASCEKNGENGDVLILTATSGDTGKAALSGFADVPGTKVIVFYPADGVSKMQQLQMVTQEGSNVCVCAVKGNFDDAQRGVKRAFSEIKRDDIFLSSANSINVGRLAPQVAYYFKAYGNLLKTGRIKYGDKINFAVPTGNFGNILAGYIAKLMGLPIGKFICASNSNDVLTQFLSTGVYDRRRPFYQTASPSMDILVSSNLERLLYLESGGDDKLTAGLMDSLNEKGFYSVPDKLLTDIQEDFLCGCADDEQSYAAIRSAWEQNGYLIDPHTSVAFHVLNKLKAEGQISGETVVLSTASPYKFANSMLRALGINAPDDGFEALELLHSVTGVPVPENLSSLKNKPVLHRDVVLPDNITSYVEMKAGEKSWKK